MIVARVVAISFRTWFIFAILCLMCFPQSANAHALLEQANPAPDSHLSSSPTDITLTFNERLERELFYIKVLDNQGNSVTQNPTKMSQNQKELHLVLPRLPDGIYTVTYGVLSEDGHPVRSSYIISVGNVPLAGETDGAKNVDAENGRTTQWWFFGIRIIYYISLLLLAGWVAWGISLSFESKEIQHSYRIWMGYLQKAFLVALLAMIFAQLADLLTEWNLNEITSLLLKTSAGLSLTMSLVLSILGFFILQRKNLVDALWVIGLLAAKSISGHAMAIAPPLGTVLLDLIHLLAASIWAGGLLYLLLFWKKHRESIRPFLPVFSKAALTNIIVLIVTGTLSTSIFLPDLNYILKTTWGLLLLAKVSLVCVVIIIGAIIRYRIKRNSTNDLDNEIKVDFCAMILITAIVGVFTYLSPQPQNQPLYWHEMGKSYMMTTQITPNVPGVNHFSVDVTSSKTNLYIKNVQLSLTNQDNTDIAPIKVPLKVENSPKNTSSSNEQLFVSDGPYLPFAGKWTIEVRIMDSDDNETVHSKNFTIYKND